MLSHLKRFSSSSLSRRTQRKLKTTAKFRLNIHFFIGGIPDWRYMTLKMRLCIKKAFCVLKVTIYNGGQMTAWPVFARCNGGQKTALQWLTRVKKVISRREREIWKQFLPFREEKEKSEFTFPSFEKRKRNLKTISLISRGERESWIPFP